MFKKTTFVALAITLLLGGPALAAQSVVIAPYDWTFQYIPDSASFNPNPPNIWMYLSVRDRSTARGTDIIMWPNDAGQSIGGNEQRWLMWPQPDGSYGFQNSNSSLCLYGTNKPGESLHQDGCDPSNPYDKWLFVNTFKDPSTPNTVGQLKNEGSGLYMDVSGGGDLFRNIYYISQGNVIDNWYAQTGASQNQLFIIYPTQ